VLTKDWRQQETRGEAVEQLILDMVRASRDLGDTGLVLLALFFFVISLTFLPRPPACIVAGLVYGMTAFPVVLAASLFGAVAGFLMSRHLFQARFRLAIEPRPNWRSIADAIDSEGWVLVFLLRLASPVPGSATTYLLGLSGIGLWPYASATFLGLAPQTFLFVLIGAAPTALEGGSFSILKLIMLLAGIVTSAVILWQVGRRARASLSSRLNLVHPLLAPDLAGDKDAPAGQSRG
jgi:uncharacterized membrane protein YdjX (TVP38/TMEM64 family)